MAETNKVVFEAEVKGTAQVQKSFSDLKKELKELRDAQGYIAEGSRAWKGLQKSINEVEGQIGDLTDRFNTLRGSGVERVNASIGLFKEGLLSFDFGKIGIALKGLGSAFKAVLPFAIIEGFKMLYENWDKIVAFVGKLIPALSQVSKETKRLQEENDALAESTKRTNALYQTQITLLEALGNKDKEIREVKSKMLENDIKQLEIQQKLNRAKEEDAARTSTLYEQTLKLFHLDTIANDERQERLKKFSDEGIKIENELSQKRAEASANRIKDLNEQIKKTKEHSDAVIKKMIDEAKAVDEHGKKVEDYEKRRIDNAEKISQGIKNEAERRIQIAQDERKWKEEEAAKEQAIKDAAKKVDDEIRAASLKADLEAVEEFKKNEQKKRDEAIKYQNESFENARNTTLAIQSLSDTVFAIRMAKAQKGSAEEERLARRQFEINKALQLSTAVINGAQSILAITSVPDFTLGVNTALRIAAQVALTAGTIAKIATTKFNPGGGGGDTSAPSIPSVSGGGSAPTTNTQAPAIQPFTRLDEEGNVTGRGGMVKAYVVETEMTDKQKRVGRLENQATFG